MSTNPAEETEYEYDLGDLRGEVRYNNIYWAIAWIAGFAFALIGIAIPVLDYTFPGIVKRQGDNLYYATGVFFVITFATVVFFYWKRWRRMCVQLYENGFFFTRPPGVFDFGQDIVDVIPWDELEKVEMHEFGEWSHTVTLSFSNDRVFLFEKDSFHRDDLFSLFIEASIQRGMVVIEAAAELLESEGFLEVPPFRIETEGLRWYVDSLFRNNAEECYCPWELCYGLSVNLKGIIQIREQDSMFSSEVHLTGCSDLGLVFAFAEKYSGNPFQAPSCWSFPRT